MCEDRCDWLWPHDSFERFKTFLVPLRTVPLSMTSNDFFSPEPERTATSLAIFVTNPDSLGFTNRDSVTYPFKRSIGRIRQVLALIFLVSLLNPKYNKVERDYKTKDTASSLNLSKILFNLTSWLQSNSFWQTMWYANVDNTAVHTDMSSTLSQQRGDYRLQSHKRYHVFLI